MHDRIGRVGVVLVALVISISGLFNPQLLQAADSCSLFVDNQASGNGDGSQSRPWTAIPLNLDLPRGSTLCIRGNASGASRVYRTDRIVLRNDGTSAAPLTLMAYPGERVTLVGTDGGPVIKIEGDYWTVEGLTIDNDGQAGPAVKIEDTADYAVLRQNEIRNGSYNGLEMAGLASLVENNHIHNFELPDRDAECILVTPTSDRAIIRGNTIHDCSGNGIELYYPSLQLVSLNTVADHVQILGNVIYRGATPRADVGLGIKAGTYITVAGNDISGYRDNPAADVHRLSRYVLFDGNRIHDSDRGINVFADNDQAPEHTILRNNLIYRISDPDNGYGIQVVGAVAPQIVHNTFVDVAWRAISIGGNGMPGGTIRNNLVYDSGASRRGPDTPLDNVTISHNGWFNASTNFGSPTDVSGSGNPGFVASGDDDFHLSAGSRAINEGTNIGLAVDFEGDPRQVDCCPDLGADEYTPRMRLSARGGNGMVALQWNDASAPGLASYDIVYTAPAGARAASQGASPIANLPASARAFTLNGLTNYVYYSISVVGRDANGAELFVSNSVRAMPSDRNVYLPAINQRP
jgi:hypothetical protein